MQEESKRTIRKRNYNLREPLRDSFLTKYVLNNPYCTISEFSKVYWLSIVCSKLLHKMGQDILDRQYE